MIFLLLKRAFSKNNICYDIFLMVFTCFFHGCIIYSFIRALENFLLYQLSAIFPLFLLHYKAVYWRKLTLLCLLCVLLCILGILDSGKTPDVSFYLNHSIIIAYVQNLLKFNWLFLLERMIELA